MRSSVRDREFGRVAPLCFTCGKNRSEDAHQFPGIPDATEWVHYSGGLLPGLVEKNSRGTFEFVVASGEYVDILV